jgi:hypothetical protein
MAVPGADFGIMDRIINLWGEVPVLNLSGQPVEYCDLTRFNVSDTRVPNWYMRKVISHPRDSGEDSGAASLLHAGGNHLATNRWGLLIAARTAHDTNLTALDAVLSEWTRTEQTYSQRIDHLLNGGGRNGPVVLKTATVQDDSGGDRLSGSAARDWFFGKQSAPAADVLLDRPLDEVLVDLP